jgi:hypothetical protein
VQSFDWTTPMPAAISPDLRQQLEALHREGVPNTEIANRLGLGRNTVTRYLQLAKQRGATRLSEDPLALSTSELEYLHRLAKRMAQNSVCGGCKTFIYLLARQQSGRCHHCGKPWLRPPETGKPRKDGRVDTCVTYEPSPGHPMYPVRRR